MAQFMGKVRGNKGETSRLGSKNSGLTTECNTWTAGITAEASIDEDGVETIRVFATHGSKGDGTKRMIGALESSDRGVKWFPLNGAEKI